MKIKSISLIAILLMALALLVGCDSTPASPTTPEEREGTDDIYLLAVIAMNHYIDIMDDAKLKAEYVTVKEAGTEPNPEQEIITVSECKGINEGGEGTFTISVQDVTTALENGWVRENLIIMYNSRKIQMNYTYKEDQYDSDAYLIWVDDIPYRFDRVPF